MSLLKVVTLPHSFFVSGTGSYDVQNVSANSPQEGVLCITCSFMKGSSDIGCYSELTHTTHNTGYTALHIGREKGEESVSGCVTKLEEGLYNIAVYDIETNGRRATPPAVILTDIRIMNNEIMTTSSTNTVLPSPTGIIETTTNPSVSCECHVTCHVIIVHV